MPKAPKKRAAATVAAGSKEPLLERAAAVLGRRAAVFAVGLALLATIRIVSTYTVFSHTSDEPAHLACGMQWLDQHVYRYEAQHPPLPRIMAALGPYLDGARSAGQSEMFMEGNAILYAGDSALYDRRLALSRAGNLPFFWLACGMVFLWGRRTLGSAGAALAVLIFTMIPTVLAHAALATTDMAVTAFFAAAAYAMVRLAEEPGPKTAAWLGLAGGLMVLSKFSALVYFPVAFAATLVLWFFKTRPSGAEFRYLLFRRLPWLGLAAVIGLAVIWAGYRFSFGKTVWTSFPLPFPELYAGIKEVADHNAKGHLSYFMGELRMNGWWAFFPVLIAVKLPISVLGLAAAGIWRGRDRDSTAWPFGILMAIPAAILLVSLPSNINIGIRHILPMFPFLAVLAAAGLTWLSTRPADAAWARWCATAAVLWLCVSSLAAHPDYLPYFNALAGSEPERIVVDSDLDWGQDIKRLGRHLRELKATSVAFSPEILVNPARFGFPPYHPTALDAPYPGWNAVQLTGLKLYRMGLRMEEPNTRLWPESAKPVERIGGSILLFYNAASATP
ncbi:MAG TPA: glycosyltransferase family 39 protein [Bryobacteraceae bacterium]|jgi:hypothetical protein|nr:glycosyltransferase family 39 protein [Bryobacteraceae bacterium]